MTSFTLLHRQTGAVAEDLKALRERRASATWLKAKKRDPGFNSRSSIAYGDSSRHRLEVEHVRGSVRCRLGLDGIALQVASDPARLLSVMNWSDAGAVWCIPGERESLNR